MRNQEISRREIIALPIAATIAATMPAPSFDARTWISDWLGLGHAISLPPQGGIAVLYAGAHDGRFSRRSEPDWARTDLLERDLVKLENRRAIRAELEARA